MSNFLNELPALIITVFVLAIFALVTIIEHLSVNDTLALAGVLAVPALSFWFSRNAYSVTQPPATPLQGGGTTAQQEKQA